MKLQQYLIGFSVVMVLLTGCSKQSEYAAPAAQNKVSSSLWKVKDMPYSDQVKELFPKDIYEMLSVDVNGKNITDEYLKYRITLGPPSMDPKVKLNNNKVREVLAIRKKDNPDIIYFYLNRDLYYKGDFSKDPVMMEYQSKTEMVPYKPEETLLVVKRTTNN